MSESPRQLIPQGLGDLPPGPELGRVLEGIDPSRLTAGDAEAVMVAWHRQSAHVQGRCMEAMVWFGLCRPAPPDQVAHDREPSEAAADEVRAALVWTRRAADDQFFLAWDLQSRLPEVHEALVAGRVDLPRARVLAEWTRELTPEQAERICSILLPQAGGLTTGELVDRVKQMAIAVDPEWAARRYRQAVRSRRVVGYRNPDGTGTVSGQSLPLDQAVAASANVDRLARRVKTAGDGRPIDHIRADLFLGLLDGGYTGWSEQQIIDHLLDRQRQDRCPDDAQEPEGAQAKAQEPEGAQAQDAGSARWPSEDSDPKRGPDVGRAPGPGTESASTSEPRPEPSAESPGRPGPGRAERAELDSEPELQEREAQSEPPRQEQSAPPTPAVGAAGDRRPDAGGDGGPSVNPRAGFELRVRLSTLLGLDRFPAEIPGWGYVDPHNARRWVAANTGAQWLYVVCGDDGALSHEGLIFGRPAGYPARVRTRGGVVEIQIPLRLLQELAEHPDRHPPWADVIDRIIRDLAAGHGDGGRPDGRDRRFPGVGLRRRVQTRDRRCLFPGCRMPAARTDADHIRQWIRSGRTQEDNLVSLCRHDHRLKDAHGWRLEAVDEQRVRWTSRLGLTYTVARPQIIIALPHLPGRPAESLDPADLDGPPSGPLGPRGDLDGGPIWCGPYGPRERVEPTEPSEPSEPSEQAGILLVDDEVPPF